MNWIIFFVKSIVFPFEKQKILLSQDIQKSRYSKKIKKIENIIFTVIWTLKNKFRIKAFLRPKKEEE